MAELIKLDAAWLFSNAIFVFSIFYDIIPWLKRMCMKRLFFALCLMPCALSPALAADDCRSRKSAPDGQLSLQQVVELGLCRNPTTASAYYAAESARLNKNAGYANYLPSVNASASVGKDYRNKEWDEVSLGASVSAS